MNEPITIPLKEKSMGKAGMIRIVSETASDQTGDATPEDVARAMMRSKNVRLKKDRYLRPDPELRRFGQTSRNNDHLGDSVLVPDVVFAGELVDVAL